MKNESISDMQFFVLVARHGSLAAAARASDLTPPAATKRLAALESRLGVRLLNRTTRSVVPTEAGLSLLARLEPAELLVPDEENWPEFLRQRTGVRRRAPWLFDADSGRRQLLAFFKLHDLSGFGIDDKPRATAAASALLGYVEETQKQRLPHLTATLVASLVLPRPALATTPSPSTPPGLHRMRRKVSGSGMRSEACG